MPQHYYLLDTLVVTINIWASLSVLLSSVSLLSLLIISLERAFAIRWPFRHRVASSSIYSFYIISIITVWIIGLGLMTLFLLETYTNKVGALTSTLIINGTKFISLYLISVTYLKIRKRLRDTNPAVALEAHNRKTVEQNVRLSRTIFLVIGLLFGLWLPALVMYYRPLLQCMVE